MIAKLVKYEIRATSSWMRVTYGLFAAIGIVIPLIIKVLQLNKIFSFWSSILPKIVLIMVIAVFYFIIDRYISSFYGYETPLMFGIPVKGRYLLLAKLINAFLWLTIGFLLIVMSSYMISFLSKSIVEIVTDMIGIINRFGMITLRTILNFLLFAVAAILLIMQIYFSITVSRMRIWQKSGVLIGILTFAAIVFLEVRLFIYANKGTNILLWLIENWTWSTHLVPILSAVALSAGMFIATAALIEKKTNLK